MRCTNRLVNMATLILTFYTSHHVTVKSYSLGKQAARPFFPLIMSLYTNYYTTNYYTTSYYIIIIA